ncbi:MAG: RNA polymerase sigma factor [Myxococcota bacterium]
MHDPSDEALFAAHLAGDRAAFARLIGRWTPALRATMRRGGVPDDEVDELVQDVFLHLHRSAADFTPGAPLRPWIVTLALNLRRDWQRRPARRVQWVDAAELTDPAPAASTALERHQDQQRVRRSVSALPPDQRAAVQLHWLGGLPFAEVARVVGGSIGAVRVRAHRGYERLRASLRGEE